MNAFSTWRIRRAAHRDAAGGINSVEQLVVAFLSSRPAVDPSNLRHAGLVAATRTTPLQRDWQEDLRAREQEYADCTSPVITLPAIALIVLIEIWGAVRVLKGMGVSPAERGPFGAALGLGLLALTLHVARRAQPQATGSTSWGQRVGTTLLFGIYAVVVAALAYSRAQEAGAQLTGAALGAEIVIMVSATVGPAWISETLYAAFTKARRLKRDIRRLRRELKQAERRRRPGDVFTARMSVQTEAWDRAAAEIRAIYTAEHRHVAARRTPATPALPARTERRDS